MNISKQLKNYRKEFNISQEELAEIVHVSRQTISNWENSKSYPDLQSLLLLSDYFKISLDELVKGDVVIMKNELELKRFEKMGMGAFISIIFMFTTIIVAEKLDLNNVLVSAIGVTPLLYFTIRMEIFKKNKDLKTYSEITNYINKKEQVQIDPEERRKKVMKENITGLISGGIVGCGILYLLMKFVY